MFSTRTAWDRTPNRLAAALERKKRAGTPLIDLTESNPTRAGFSYPDGLLHPLGDARGLRYEPAAAGLPAAREAVAADYARRGLEVPPDRVVLTASTSEAYALLFKLLCDPGDEVLVPRPSYPLFDYLAGLEAVRVRPYPLAFDGEWHLPASSVAVSASPGARAVVVVHPNNPTGTFLKRDEAEALLALCAERGMALVADEVFADYAFAGDARRYPGAAADGPALAFALGGLWKSCGLPQLKLGWIAVAGPPTLRAEAIARLEIVADTYLSVATPVQHALPGLLVRRAELQAPIQERVLRNREWLLSRLAGAPAHWPAAEGGWYAVLRVPASVPDEERALELLERHDVLVHPGYFFDFPREGHLVLSLITPPADFEEGVRRLLAVL